ncbi:MAG: tetratricopeptide repeat protein [Candidatus Acidiferrales bacterium]
MEIPLEGSPYRNAILVVSLLILGGLLQHGIRRTLAQRDSESTNFEHMQKAVKLEPGNADYWDLLGRFKELDFEQPDINAAIQYFNRAVQLSPRNSAYWIDLSTAYEQAGDAAHARQALDTARAVYPASAEVVWEYGNYLLRQGEFDAGLAQIRQAIRIDPSLLPLAISRSWRANGNVNQLLDQMLPVDADAYFQALDFFASIHAVDPGMVVWRRILALQATFPLARSFPFLDELIRQDRTAETREVWRDAVARSGPVSMGGASSLVWDGSFDQEFANGGLGWRVSDLVGVSWDFDTKVFVSPPRSLRVDFGGATNLDLCAPSQFVPVEPNRTYRFQGSLRTDVISTESGIRFAVFDPQHSDAPDLLTPSLTGTNEWVTQTGTIATGPSTHFLEICVRRRPSRLFENRLSGTAWVDDISLYLVEAPSGASSQ